MLRILIAVNLFSLLAAFARSAGFGSVLPEFVTAAALLEPTLILCLLLVYLAAPALSRLRYGWGVAALGTLVIVCVSVLNAFLAPLLGSPEGRGAPLRPASWAALAVVALLYYFHLRERAIAPALAEARLMALTARIRPHFLFNSLNAVLGVMRSEPRRAEHALEELSDLFRVLMADNRELVRLSDEIGLCRQYLELERLRLGDRLQVEWRIESCPPDALVPPLMLQPLLENAVYHGIEPGEEPGLVVITIARASDEVLISIENPYRGAGGSHPGNRMALDNIRERLMLFFDLEARLASAVRGEVYRVDIRLPYRSKK